MTTPSKHAPWVPLTRRTQHPKLGYIIMRLERAGIACRYATDRDGRTISTWHADRVLEVRATDERAAWTILGEPWARTTALPSARGRTTLDDMPDDHATFAPYADVHPTSLQDAEEGWDEEGWDPVRDGWVGRDGRP